VTLDREVALRDLANGREIMHEKLPTGTARAAISRDGRWLAYGGALESIVLVDLASGEKRELKVTLPPELESTYHFVRLLGFTDDSQSLVVGGLDGFVRVWDVSSGSVRTKIELGKVLPICMQLSHQGDWAAVGDNNARLRLFDLHTGKLLRELVGHDAAVWSLALSPDGKRLASGDNDARVIVWDVATGENVANQHTSDGWITSLCFSPDGATLAMGRADSTIRLLHIEDESAAGVLRGHRHGVIAIDWRDDGTLHTVSLDGTAKTWNPHAALQVPTIVTKLPQTGGLAFDPAGRRLFVGALKGTVRGWVINREANDQPPETADNVPAHDDPVTEIATDRTHGRVCTTGRDGALCISSLNGDAAATLRVMTNHTGGISAIDFARDGSRVVVSGGGAISMWDARSGAKLGDYSPAHVVATDLSFAPDGQSFYAACADGRVRRWRVGSENPIAQVQVDPGIGMYDVDVSPDGRTLVACGDTQSLVLLDAETLQVIRRFAGHQGSVFGVAFHPQGKRVASCGSDRTIRIWDIETGTELLTLRGHRRTIFHVQFSPDGQTLASSSDDGTVKLWRTPSR
jgi:WD40 repeat protein